MYFSCKCGLLLIIERNGVNLQAVYLDPDWTAQFDQSDRESVFFPNWFVAQNRFGKKKKSVKTIKNQLN